MNLVISRNKIDNWSSFRFVYLEALVKANFWDINLEIYKRDIARFREKKVWKARKIWILP